MSIDEKDNRFRSLGENLFNLRITKGLSVHQLATRANVAPNMIYYLESGRTLHPQMSKMKKIARALGVKVGAIYGITMRGED